MRHMRAAAGAAVRAGEGDDAHIARKRLFAAVRYGIKLCTAIEMNVDGVVFIDVLIGARLERKKRFPRNVGVKVDGGDLRAQVEADIVAAVLCADQTGTDVLAGMLLHVVEAPRPVKRAMHRRTGAQRSVAQVRDHAALFTHVKHLYSVEHAAVAWLPAALGVTSGLIQNDRPAALSLLTGEHRGGKFAQKGAGIIEFFRFHGKSFFLRGSTAPFRDAEGADAFFAGRLTDSKIVPNGMTPIEAAGHTPKGRCCPISAKGSALPRARGGRRCQWSLR